jgi:hypothetical protein
MNIRKIGVMVLVGLLSAVFFFCNKSQPPTAPSAPAIKILSFSPTTARIGDQIVITGENFSSDKTADSIFFSHGRLAAIDSIADSSTVTKLYVRVPQGTITGTIVVRVGSSIDTSKEIFTLDTLSLPKIISVQPGSGPLGTIVTITGSNFDTIAGHTIVTIGGVQEKIISISSTKIVVEITGGTTGTILITMDGNSLTTPTSFTVTKRNEAITLFTPARGKVGTQVTISGTNFNPDTTGLVVAFGAVTAQVLSVTTTQIVTVVPTSAVTAPISVSFFGEQATSATPFQVEGKYQFDSCYVTMINIPITLAKNNQGSVDTIYAVLNYPLGLTNFQGSDAGPYIKFDSVQLNDSINYGNTSPYGSVYVTVSVTLDTTSNKFSIFNLTEDDNSYADFNRNAKYIMTLHNAPFFIEGDSLLVKLNGQNAFQYFINGVYTNGTVGHGYEDVQTAVQFLPFTDSTYIKIVLK